MQNTCLDVLHTRLVTLELKLVITTIVKSAIGKWGAGLKYALGNANHKLMLSFTISFVNPSYALCLGTTYPGVMKVVASYLGVQLVSQYRVHWSSGDSI